MRTRLASRSARLALAAAAALALAAGATATANAGTFTGDGGAGAASTACDMDELNFTVSEETQAGGYLLVTAEAKSHVTCFLEGVTPSASFGSDADTQVSPAEHGPSDRVTVSGMNKAYFGVNPKSVNEDGGVQFDVLHLAVEGDEYNPVTLDLPHTVTVNKPIATNWHNDPSEAVPFAN
ncbi:DUF4232 domain-containing protein [Streptomyces armeniacus]|nr:DUF4232 domain-containing protein [Streptomyces armeniacus]